MNRSKSLVCILFAAAMVVLPAIATAEKSAEAPSFGEIVDVRVVNLEVVVTHKGQRVEGLDRDSFQLLIDGQEMPIEYFTEVRHGQAVASADASPSVPALEPGEPVGTRYLVFIDDWFAIPAYRNQALRALSEQLTFLGPRDQMAIVAFDGQRVEMLSSWTRSLVQLNSALDVARDRTAFGLQRQSEQRRVDTLARFDGLGALRDFGPRFSRGLYDPLRTGLYSYTAFDRSYEEEVGWQISRVVQGATSALRAFAQPPGRKVMLLLSGGWPGISVDETSPARYAVRDFQVFNPLIDTANRLGYSLYPVDLNTDPGILQSSAEYGDILSATLVSERRRARDDWEEDSLFYLARATGGRPAIDGGRNSALRKVVEDTRSYYWLGFTPTWAQNDERHRIEIKMNAKGLKARARDSYSDLSRQSQITMMVESAQLFELPLEGQGGLGVSFGTPIKAGFRKVAVPVRLEIPLDRVTLTPVGDGYAANLELRVAATDDDGGNAEIPVVPVSLNRDGVPPNGSVAVFETSLKLRSKPHRLLLSIYDPTSGRLLSERVDLAL